MRDVVTRRQRFNVLRSEMMRVWTTYPFGKDRAGEINAEFRELLAQGISETPVNLCCTKDSSGFA